jgi:RHS repeat-associated protein
MGRISDKIGERAKMIKIARIGALLLVILAGGFLSMAMAQGLQNMDLIDKRSPHGIMPNTDQLADPLDTINPATGKMNVSIPLGSLTGGRAGLKFDLALNYDSNLYDKHESWMPGYHHWWLTPSYDSGWKYSISNYRLELQSGGPYACRPYRLRLGLPDGSSHILHLASMPGFTAPSVFVDGFYGVSPSGTPDPYQGCSAGWTLPEDQKVQYDEGAGPLWLLTYYTVDGSYLKVEIYADGDNVNSWKEHKWRLYYPDGRMIVGIYDNAKEIYDANGNKIEIVGTSDQSGEYTTIRYADGSNREMVIQHDYQLTETIKRDKITAPGPNGTMTWYVDWTNDFITQIQLPMLELPPESETAAPIGATPLIHRSYEIVYNSLLGSLGELKYIRPPSGTVYQYAYIWDDYNSGCTYYNDDYQEKYECSQSPELPATNAVQIKKIVHDNGQEMVWSYAYDNCHWPDLSPGVLPGGMCTDLINPDGGHYRYYHSAWTNYSNEYIFGDLGLVYRIDGPNGSVVKRNWKSNNIDCGSICNQSLGGADRNFYVGSESVTVGNDLGQRSKSAVTDYTYDKNGNPTAKTEYDWVDYAGGASIEAGTTIRRRTVYNYYISMPDASEFDMNYWDPEIYPNGYWQPHNLSYWAPGSGRRLNAVKILAIADGSRLHTITIYNYDEPYTKGNVVYEYRWVEGDPYNPYNYILTLSHEYDEFGNIADIYEPEVRAHFVYDATGSLLTQVYTGYGTSAQRMLEYEWTINGAAIHSKTDVDKNITTTYTYNDIGRRTIVDEGSLRKMVTSYNDVDRNITIESDLHTYEDGMLQTRTWYDQLGRPALIQKSDGAPLAYDWDGIKAATFYLDSEYGGRRVISSSPFRNGNDATLEWTCTQYDQGGRVTAVAMFKGSAAPTHCESIINRTGITRTQYDGAWTIVTDPARNKRKQRRDALGRLVEAVEDPDGSFNYHTFYAYNPLNNLTGVDQGSQTRTFEYNGLGWLTSATNPESNTIAYAYFSSGDLHTRSDARGVMSTMEYDSLHRITSKTYNNGTPSVNYQYHLAGLSSAPNVGQLKKVEVDNSTSSEFTYTPLGNVETSTQTIYGALGTQVFNFSYDWYLNGSLKTEIYPSERQVDYSVDNAGRTNKITAGATTYANVTGPSQCMAHPFTADGRIAQMQLGNGLWETRDYQTSGNTPTSYNLGTSACGIDVLRLEYNFDATGYNNGNVVSQSIYRPGGNWYQSFQYDGVNRLSKANESGGFNQTYGYDQHGNRSVTSSTGLAHNNDPNELQSNSHSSLTNRLVEANYDLAGNQTSHGANGAVTLTYDAEGRTVSATNSQSGNGTSYFYDGDGRRVKKVWAPSGQSAITTYYVYDALGRLATEISNDPQENTGTAYLFSDMLGSVRTITSQRGSATECYDYLPFGRMLSALDNGRTINNTSCFQADPDNQVDSGTPQKFTGKERDNETGLDYFGARYYSGAQGRFTSPDWSATPTPVPYADLNDPQSLNLYGYVRNNPINNTDPNGHWCYRGIGTTCVPDPPPPLPAPGVPPFAFLDTDIGGNKTYFIGHDVNGVYWHMEIETRVRPCPGSLPGAGGGFSSIVKLYSDNAKRDEGRKEFGPAVIDVGDPRGRHIHGGSSNRNITDPFADYQFAPGQIWTCTYGCTRSQNIDVINLKWFLLFFDKVNQGSVPILSNRYE